MKAGENEGQYYTAIACCPIPNAQKKKKKKEEALISPSCPFSSPSPFLIKRERERVKERERESERESEREREREREREIGSSVKLKLASQAQILTLIHKKTTHMTLSQTFYFYRLTNEKMYWSNLINSNNSKIVINILICIT